MKIIEPSFSLITPFGPLTPERGIELLRFVEANARISHRAEAAQTSDSWKRFIQAVVVQHADWSVTEHSSVTAVLRVDRGISHQLVRHRLFAFTQESQRFVSYKKKGGEIEVIRPIDLPEEAETFWNISLIRAELSYFEMLEKGIAPEDARSVLPNATATTLSMTSNLRNWRSFFMARCSNEAHPDMKRIVIPMLQEFKRCIPILFDDLEVEVKQSISLARAR